MSETTTADKTATTFEITADDVAALRTADSVSFHYYEGRSYIHAGIGNYGNLNGRIYSAKEQRIFPANGAGTSDRTREIACKVRMHGYKVANVSGALGWTLDSRPNSSAFAHRGTAQYNDVWKTIAAIISAGSTITLEWTADNNTENISQVGFHADELRIKVNRGKQTYVFLLEYQVGPDNTARMIRMNG